MAAVLEVGTTQEVDELLQSVFEELLLMRPWASEPVGLGTASGRTLARAVLADRDLPAFDRVMMDGFICHVDDLLPKASARPLVVLDRALLAGTDPLLCTMPNPGQCVVVATGASWPPGACRSTFRVVPVESFDCEGLAQTVPEQQEVRHFRSVSLKGGAQGLSNAGQHLHLKGSDCQTGTVLIPDGMVLGAIELALCATVGLTLPVCRRRPRIKIVTTGSEIVQPDCVPLAHQLRSSHPAMLAPLLVPLADGEPSVLHVSDDASALLTSLVAAAESADVVLLTGGVSRGPEDFTRPVLENAGAEILVHRVRQRPGFPFLCARMGTTMVFGLPGNPLSVLCCAARYVIPWLKAVSAGIWPQTAHRIVPESAQLCPSVRADGFSRYVALARTQVSRPRPAVLGQQSRSEKAEQLRPIPDWAILSAQNSGDFASWSGANGIVEVSQRATVHVRDGLVSLPWYSFTPASDT